ncbi:hypothetical protein NEOLEDRAFT_1077953 [Neolentinus lepideus HHB14362 ss-1]|uniref:CxC2-like cysteine cluster KDZ transposase-associated domain-containing protein n=1 Tax=Neolentinus lepideus HHB14362 ss-1 TaxID=1314782 RepID=A0A165N9Q2_9AGAM|nr:hypothetical protein NEOLEDRAFT_1077953 [Neolentinus lepideus HHB14362 ss-1]
MWTGKWWHAVQTGLPVGSTIAPVIISTDKTQLTQFSRSCQAYPIYLTIGNLLCRPSEHGTMLLGYLSADKILSSKLTKTEKKMKTQHLFHASMHLILYPLRQAGIDSVEVICGDGSVRHVYPILVCYVTDYPEQVLVTCSKSGTCPKCQCRRDGLQDLNKYPPCTADWIMSVITEGETMTHSTTQHAKFCMSQDFSGSIHHPFWEGFPFTDIHISITPDVLHQLYQGIFKHIVKWCTP